ncbi:MAG: hypothetical protein ACPG5U_01665 [Planktomarina sp.]
MFGLPLVGGATLGVTTNFIGSVVVGVLWVTYVFNLPTRYLGLIVSFFGWLTLSGALLAVVTQTLSGILIILCLWFAAIVIAVRHGTAVGHARVDRKAMGGHPIREWQWVYTGAKFARAHRCFRWHPILVLGIALPVAVASIYLGILGYATWMIPALIIATLPLISWCVFTIWSLLARSPGGWIPAWTMLFLSFPISVPWMVLWSDSTRLNLIYRHRFEHLVPLNAA